MLPLQLKVFLHLMKHETALKVMKDQHVHDKQELSTSREGYLNPKTNLASEAG